MWIVGISVCSTISHSYLLLILCSLSDFLSAPSINLPSGYPNALKNQQDSCSPALNVFPFLPPHVLHVLMIFYVYQCVYKLCVDVIAILPVMEG